MDYPTESNYTTPIIQVTTVSDSVYNWIKTSIINGDIKPGEHIVQEDLTKKLGVSRTPVRDAISRLQSEGLVICRPHAGAVVTKISRQSLDEIYEIRILLEQFCIRRSCLNATPSDIAKAEQINLKMLNTTSTQEFMKLDRAFHYAIWESSGCENAMVILNDLMNKCDSFKSIYYATKVKRDNTVTEHAHILEGLKKHDIQMTENALSTHLKDVVSTVASVVNLDGENN